MKNKKYIIAFFGGVFIFACLIGLQFLIPFPEIEQLCDKEKQKWHLYTFRGLVLENFKDSKDHMYGKIKLNQNKSTLVLDFGSIDFFVYNQISVGDSLFKESSEDTLKIVRNGDSILLNITFSCD